MKLRLIEQACGCSTVRGGGRLTVRARLCLCRVLLCMPPRPGTRWHLPAGGGAFATEAAMNEAPTDRANLRLLLGARRRSTQGVCASLLVQSACRHDQAPGGTCILFVCLSPHSEPNVASSSFGQRTSSDSSTDASPFFRPATQIGTQNRSLVELLIPSVSIILSRSVFDIQCLCVHLVDLAV